MDQADGKSVEDMNILGRKQSFLSNVHGMLDGYAQHGPFDQEEFIDRMEERLGGVDNFSARLVGTAIGYAGGTYLEKQQPRTYSQCCYLICARLPEA